MVMWYILYALHHAVLRNKYNTIKTLRKVIWLTIGIFNKWVVITISNTLTLETRRIKEFLKRVGNLSFKVLFSPIYNNVTFSVIFEPDGAVRK